MEDRREYITSLIIEDTITHIKMENDKIEKDFICLIRKEKRKGNLKGRFTKQKISKLGISLIFSYGLYPKRYIGVLINGLYKPYFRKYNEN